MKFFIIFFFYLHTNLVYTFECANLCTPILKKDGREIRSVCTLDSVIKVNGYTNLNNTPSIQKELIDRIINGLNNYKTLNIYEKQHMKARQGLKHTNFFRFLDESIKLLEQNNVPQFELNAENTDIYLLREFIDRIKDYSSYIEVDFKKYFDFFQDDGVKLYEQKIAKFIKIYTSYDSYRIHFFVHYPSSLSLDKNNRSCLTTDTLPLFYTEDISGQPKKRFHENEVIDELYELKATGQYQEKCKAKCIKGYTCVSLTLHGNQCINNKYLN